MGVHRVKQVGGALGVALLLGACEVEVGKMPPPTAPGPAGAAGGPQQVAAGPRPTAPAPSVHRVPPPPPEARKWTPPPPPPPALHAIHPARILHPLPALNLGQAKLVVEGITLRPNRRCGPRELAGGHWIHLDCNVHTPIASAKPASVEAHKILLAMKGGLKLDTPVSAAAPDGVDHRQDGTEGPIKDQGQVGACTSFSLSSAMDNAIRRQNKGDTMSSLHIWSHYGFPSMQSAGDANINKAIADLAVWPYDERIACELDQSGGEEPCGPYNPAVTQGAGSSDPAVLASEKSADTAAQWKVTEYDAVPTDPDSIANLLATGSDIWFSMEIGNSWMNPNGDTIADWDSNSIDGGHAVLLSGYRHKNGTRQFLVHNSWGTSWADNGFAYISEAMVKQFIKSAYKVVVVNASVPPPPPTAATGAKAPPATPPKPPPPKPAPKH